MQQSLLINEPERKRVDIDCAEDLFDEILLELSQSLEKETLILFVHGRGDHPEKAFKEGLVADLETDNSAVVVLFHWPSSGHTFNYPEFKARDAAADFASVLKALQRSVKKTEASVQLTLLVHSLGSYVLEELVTSYHEQQTESLFDNLLLSSSASSARGHALWLNKLNIAQKIFVMVNNNGFILMAACILKKARRLGASLRNSDTIVYELANNCSYINIRGLGLNHRYYLQKRAVKSPVLQKILLNVLAGGDVDLLECGAIKRIGSPIFDVL